MDTLILNGHDLTLQDVYDVAYDGRKVEIAADAYARLAKGREIMQELSKGGKAIYGFNRGVGQNKDVTIDEDFMETQNRMMLRSHSLGLPPFNTDEEVRAMMVIRLNNMLVGASCASDDLANSYRDFRTTASRRASRAAAPSARQTSPPSPTLALPSSARRTSTTRARS